jgi:hypothetical protein
MAEINLNHNQRVWSIQRLIVADILKKGSAFVVNKSFVMQDRIFAYDWLKLQMMNRLDIRFLPDEYPIWAWVKKPDLRFSGYLEKNSECVMLSITYDIRHILFSDFQKWHFVLSKCYLPIDENDNNDFERFLFKKSLNDLHYDDMPNGIKEHIKNSWNRVFEFDNNDYWGDPKKRVIQATIPSLMLSDVICFRKFIAK